MIQDRLPASVNIDVSS